MNQDPFEDIDIDTYRRRFEQDGTAYVLVDVREDDEYEAGHLPAAINVPLSEFQERFSEIEQGKPVVLVCTRGGRSAMAAQFLFNQGYTQLYNLMDGTMGWMMQGLPLE